MALPKTKTISTLKSTCRNDENRKDETETLGVPGIIDFRFLK